METIEIPSRTAPIRATVEVPGSKSITNRALLLAALGDGETVLENALFSEDTHWFSDCLMRLGITVEADQAQARFRVVGRRGEIPVRQADLFVGNAGTAARFIAGMVCLAEGSYRFDGIPRMRERPMAELLRVIQLSNATVDFEGREGYMPFTIHSKGLNGGTLRLRADKTSQQLSALLMIAPYARQSTTIEVEGQLVSRSYIDMTCRLMAQFGVAVREHESLRFEIPAGASYQARHYTVEPDASNASYFFAAAAITGGQVRVNHLGKDSLQGDIQFLTVLEAMGCTVTYDDQGIVVAGPQQLRGIDVDMNTMSDTAQTLAAIAPFASGPVTIRNIEHIRLKETERISAVVTELRRLGAHVDEFADGLTIFPSQLKPAALETYNDHRMAMAFANVGLRVPGVVIKDPGCTAKTFPDFFMRFLAMLA